MFANSTLRFFQFHFSYYEHNKLERLIGWAHPELLRLFKYRNTTVFVDGTFRCEPREFYQCLIFMVHDQGSNCYVPVLYALCTSKTSDMYWNAIHHALRRKIKKLRIPDVEVAVAMEVGMLDVLTVVETAKVEVQGVAWATEELRRRIVERDWTTFWQYFRRTWLEVFPPSTWNVFNIAGSVVSRTNNPLKRFNRELNAAFSTPHPSLPRFVCTIDAMSRRYVQLLAANRATAPVRSGYLLPDTVEPPDLPPNV
ncbi:TPA: hypothetical protein N0F65_011533 [Lagenidium giganteum]|uniref:MULE transposase domain-containing protein n=1 Tax=Lagenidium giganteum TaxID=4803 RepID=A0AAV2Z7B0_9STRA|nr:TPA: hypothetical protein N0F65_011533 [Lagenidium giganteum]